MSNTRRLPSSVGTALIASTRPIAPFITSSV
jgi:hypothetical protein